MPLDDLVGVIETLQERIRDHSPSLRENETRTRMALIDPLLQVLGWDTADPAMVTPEFNVSGRWADYALLGPGGKPVATVEAKKLGEPLGQHRMQMLNYSNASGVEYAGLTDGDHWEVYEVFQRGQLEDRRILDVSIANTPAHECALQLLLLWRLNLATGQPVLAREPIFAAKPSPDLTAFQQSTTQDTVTWSGTSTTLAEYDSSAHTHPPSSILFEDGSECLVQFWYELLAHTAEWLWSKELLTQSNIPVASGPKRYIISAEPVHPSGNSFAAPQRVGAVPLWISKHGNKLAMLRQTKALLRYCDVDPGAIQLQVAQ